MLDRSMTDPTPPDAAGAAPVSERIRARLIESGQRFHANDNISAVLREGELEALRREVAERMQGVLSALVIDTAADHNTAETAKRVAKMFVDEVFAGRYRPAPELTTFPNVSRLNELMIVGPVTCHWSFIQPRPEPGGHLRLSARVEQSPGSRNPRRVQRDGRLRWSGAGRSLRGSDSRGPSGAFRCCSR